MSLHTNETSLKELNMKMKLNLEENENAFRTHGEINPDVDLKDELLLQNYYMSPFGGDMKTKQKSRKPLSNKGAGNTSKPNEDVPEEVSHFYSRHTSDELIATNEQGSGAIDEACGSHDIPIVRFSDQTSSKDTYENHREKDQYDFLISKLHMIGKLPSNKEPCSELLEVEHLFPVEHPANPQGTPLQHDSSSVKDSGDLSPGCNNSDIRLSVPKVMLIKESGEVPLQDKDGQKQIGSTSRGNVEVPKVMEPLAFVRKMNGKKKTSVPLSDNGVLKNERDLEEQEKQKDKQKNSKEEIKKKSRKGEPTGRQRKIQENGWENDDHIRKKQATEKLEKVEKQDNFIKGNDLQRSVTEYKIVSTGNNTSNVSNQENGVKKIEISEKLGNEKNIGKGNEDASDKSMKDECTASNEVSKETKQNIDSQMQISSVVGFYDQDYNFKRFERQNLSEQKDLKKQFTSKIAEAKKMLREARIKAQEQTVARRFDEAVRKHKEMQQKTKRRRTSMQPIASERALAHNKVNLGKPKRPSFVTSENVTQDIIKTSQREAREVRIAEAQLDRAKAAKQLREKHRPQRKETINSSSLRPKSIKAQMRMDREKMERYEVEYLVSELRFLKMDEYATKLSQALEFKDELEVSLKYQLKEERQLAIQMAKKQKMEELSRLRAEEKRRKREEKEQRERERMEREATELARRREEAIKRREQNLKFWDHYDFTVLATNTTRSKTFSYFPILNKPAPVEDPSKQKKNERSKLKNIKPRYMQQ